MKHFNVQIGGLWYEVYQPRQGDTLIVYGVNLVPFKKLIKSVTHIRSGGTTRVF